MTDEFNAALRRAGKLVRAGNPKAATEAIQNALGAGFQMQRSLLLGGEDAGAFQHDVDAEIAPGQVLRVALGEHLERVSAFDVDGVALHLDGLRETAMHRVVAHQVGVGLDRAEIVDRDDVDVLAPGFIDGANDVAADAAKSVDGDFYGHAYSSV